MKPNKLERKIVDSNSEGEESEEDSTEQGLDPEDQKKDEVSYFPREKIHLFTIFFRKMKQKNLF